MSSSVKNTAKKGKQNELNVTLNLMQDTRKRVAKN